MTRRPSTARPEPVDPRPRKHAYRPVNMRDGLACSVCGEMKGAHKGLLWRALSWFGLVS